MLLYFHHIAALWIRTIKNTTNPLSLEVFQYHKLYDQLEHLPLTLQDIRSFFT